MQAFKIEKKCVTKTRNVRIVDFFTSVYFLLPNFVLLHSYIPSFKVSTLYFTFLSPTLLQREQNAD